MVDSHPVVSAGFLALALVLPALSGCQGSGGGPGASTAIAIDFPPPSTTEQSAVSVRGHADLSRVGAVRINGTSASSTDGFRNWTADVPLDAGSNALTAEALDPSGRVLATAAPVPVERAPILSEALWPAIDADQNVLYVVGAGIDAIDMATGARSDVSSPSRGRGPALVTPQGMALDVESHRLLITDDGLAAIVAIDLASGDRTVLSDDSHGSGPSMGGGRGGGGGLWGTVLAGGNVIVANAGAHALYAVDLRTGDRRILSNATHGSGPALQFSRGLALDAKRNRVLSAQDPSDPVAAIDLATGDRTVLAATLLGEAQSSPRAMTVDPTNDRVLVETQGSVVAIDLASGTPSVLSPFGAPGPAFESDPLGGALDAKHGRLLVTDPGAGAIVAVDLVSGARAQVFGLGRGKGDVLNGPAAIVQEPSSGGALVGDGGRLVAIDPATGDRRVVSGRTDSNETIGSGPALTGVTGIAMDPAGRRALVCDVSGSGWYATSRVLAVDLTDGNRVLVSGDGVGSGDPIHDATGLALDPSGRGVIVYDGHPLQPYGNAGLVAVDTTSGDRQTVATLMSSNEDTPTQLAAFGEQLYFTGTAYLGVSVQSVLYMVNRTTGASSLVTDGGTGTFFQATGSLLLDGTGTSAWMGAYSSTGPFSLEPAILRVDLTTSPARRTVVATDSRGHGPSLLNTALATTGDPSTLHALIGKALVAVDLVGGDRVYVSR